MYSGLATEDDRVRDPCQRFTLLTATQPRFEGRLVGSRRHEGGRLLTGGHAASRHEPISDRREVRSEIDTSGVWPAQIAGEERWVHEDGEAEPDEHEPDDGREPGAVLRAFFSRRADPDGCHPGEVHDTDGEQDSHECAAAGQAAHALVASLQRRGDGSGHRRSSPARAATAGTPAIARCLDGANW